MPTILISDDDAAVRASLQLLLKQSGYSTISVSKPEDALSNVSENIIDLVIMDMNYSLETSGVEGLCLLEDIKKLKPNLPVIIITAWGTISLAVEGMKKGASDFINKPWNNEHLKQSVKTVLSLSKQNDKDSHDSYSRKELDSLYDFNKIIGSDPALLKILDTIGRVSSTEAPVLIMGESGTGKELIAEAIHENSPRRNNPFVKVNLGGISRDLFESEMFGHKRGAFTDAKHDRIGRFEMADGGSIFLDEIGDLDQTSQVKLLRVLQDRSFEVLGSSKTKSVDVRVISATNRDLESMVSSGEFREDLYYRINLITVKLPSLKERSRDIPQLIENFISKLKTIYRLDELSVSKDALKWMKNLNWQGNIRELKNLVERTVLVAGKQVLEVDDFAAQIQTLPRRVTDGSLPEVGSMTVDDMEKMMIEKALEFHQRNISKVAKSLGLSRSALYRRMEKYEIEV